MMTNNNDLLELLKEHHVRPTANRLLVARELGRQLQPLSLKELEQRLCPMDKSSIFRTLVLFREKHLVHDIEDGEACVRYELCTSADHQADSDEHVHFYCASCHQTYCLDQIPVPPIELPSGFSASSVNYVVKGECPHCATKRRR